MDGSLLSDRHKEHLLEILPLIEEAFQRLGSPKAVNTWLLTPVSPGEKKPIEYLSSRQYSTFRGFLLRRYTSQRLFHPLVPSKRVYRERPREEIEEELERLIQVLDSTRITQKHSMKMISSSLCLNRAIFKNHLYTSHM